MNEWVCMVGKQMPEAWERSTPSMLHIARTSCLQARASQGGCRHRLNYTNANPSGWQQPALAAASQSAKISLGFTFSTFRDVLKTLTFNSSHVPY